MEPTSRRAVFLDRDGVLNQDSPHFIKSPDELILLPRVPEAIRLLNDLGFLCIVISNQSGVARGLVTRDNLAAMNAKLVSEIAQCGGRIDEIFFCPHGPDDECNCRKPATGMIDEACRKFGIEVSNSYLVGDKPDDVRCAKNAGCTPILALTGKTPPGTSLPNGAKPEYVAADLWDAAQWIARQRPKP